jgi:chromosomal replication initiation ATPase DnaA
VSQQRLFEFRMGERSPDTLVVSGANAAAAELLKDWRAWPGGALALVGPRGSGKTHLALAWAIETGARELAADAAPEAAAALFEAAEGRIWIDGADGARDGAMLWRLLDLARARGGAVLLAAAAAPADWPSSIKDLRSRLAALPAARLGEPDEALLELVLRRICRERFMELSEDAARYLAARLPRTFAAAHALADTLDRMVVKGARPVSIAQARRALEAARPSWQGGEKED